MYKELINLSALRCVNTQRSGRPGLGRKEQNVIFIFHVDKALAFHSFSCNNYCTSHSDRVNKLIGVLTQQQSRLIWCTIICPESVGWGTHSGANRAKHKWVSKEESGCPRHLSTCHFWDGRMCVWQVCGMCWERAERTSQPSACLKDAA